MSFPTAPINGQTTTVNGITYIYNSSNNAWKRQQLTNLVISGNITATSSLTAANYFYSNSAPIVSAAYDLDEIQADGRTNSFRPRYNNANVTISHPWAVLVTINGIFQPAFAANYSHDTVWLSRILSALKGYTIDTDGNIKFADSPAAGSTILARTQPGGAPTINKIYPFKPVDIMMGY